MNNKINNSTEHTSQEKCIISGVANSYNYTAKIRGEIAYHSDYDELYDMLEHATETDSILIKIDSGGGAVTIATSIVSAMIRCKAEIITEITGECSSAATLIFLAGDNYIVNDNIIFMVHTCSYGAMGKESDVADQVIFMQDWNRNLIYNSYKHLLTEDECEAIIKGKQHFMEDAELKERLVKMVNSYQEETTIDVEEEMEAVPDKKELNKLTKKELISYITGED